MKTFGNDLAVGIMTDEDAMYDLLSKFLAKEGYRTDRLNEGKPETDGFSLVIYAPTREFSRSKVLFENLKRKNPKVLVVQCCEEDTVLNEGNVVVLTERPLNLKQLSAAIRRTLRHTKRSAAQSV